MSSETGPGPQFLKQKYDLHNSPEVESAVKRTEHKTGEVLPNNPDIQIQSYLDRLENIINPPKLEGHEKFDRKERNLEMLKSTLFDKFITKPEDISQNYSLFLEEVIEERGQRGDWDNASEEEKQKMIAEQSETVLSDQKDSLEVWVDYLSSDDATYPDWLKYYAFRSVLGLAEYDKKEKKFPKRSRGTVKMFPDLNHEALAYVLDVLEKKYQGQHPEIPYDIQEDEKARFQQFLQGENFAKLYAWAIENINPIDEELLKTTEGEWIKYDQNSSHLPLVASIRGKGTGWCTAGETTAKRQLESGDFYVFYSNNEENNPNIPRIAIRMEGGKIAEVRGIAYKQNLDPYMGEVLTEKLQDFPDKDEYLKKEHDMSRLTEIKNKTKQGEALNKDDLIFLYEIDSKIQGFGYNADPRIKELRSGRDPKADAPIVFECAPEEIAWSQSEINERTKAYFGPLYPGIFTQLQNLEHIYTSFPEGKINRVEFVTEGRTGLELATELKNRGINVYGSSEFMLKSSEFVKAEAGEKIPTVRLQVRALFSDENSHAYSEILARANELGLGFLPHETASDLLLDERTQLKMGEYYTVVSKSITDQFGDPRVFLLERNDAGLYLGNYSAEPDSKWSADNEFVFSVRKLES